MEKIYDVAIIGGGINGCGCAAEASLRGLSVVLLEQDDLAAKTSSSSTKLIHGGLRYLEHYEFKLVKKAINERQRLLDLAPHLVHPLPLVLPYEPHMRPAWFLRLGLFLYDYISSKNCLPKCQSINRQKTLNYFQPLKKNLKKGFLFYDAATDDSRLTLANALQARQHGADIKPRTRVLQTHAGLNHWEIKVEDTLGKQKTIHAKTLINAAGPWVKQIEALTALPSSQKISLIKGSHILVPPIYDGEHAYFLQHQDKRMIFVIPYHGLSLIGTTDIPFNEDMNQIHISEEEKDYLLNLVNLYFNTTLNSKDILYTWSGVRPLLAEEQKEAKALTRDYTYQVHFTPQPMISIFGGKITTYRQLAEEVIDQLMPIFPTMQVSKTANMPLPGAALEKMNYKEYVHYARQKYHWVSPKLLARYLNTYGTCTESFLNSCNNEQDLGQLFGADLHQVEVDYLLRYEWAQTPEDILTRRTKLDLIFTPTEKNKLRTYLKNHTSEQAV